MPFLYNGVYYRPTELVAKKINKWEGDLSFAVSKRDNFDRVNKVCGKRASKMKVPPKEMLLPFSIGTFLTNYDVTIRN